MVGNIILKLKEKIDPIYKFHEQLKEKLNSTAKNYLDHGCSTPDTKTNIADVFIKMKNKFLIYAPVLDLIINAQKAIDLMILDDTGNHEIQNIDDSLLKEMERKKQKNLPTTLNSLLSRPVQHVLRYQQFDCMLITLLK